MNTLRVVVDSNVFTANRFNELDESPAKMLVQRGTVQFIYGDVALDEILGAYDYEESRFELLDRWLPFIETTGIAIPEELTRIWHKELVQGKGIHCQIFMSDARRRHFFEELRSASADGSWEAASKTRSRRLEIRGEKKKRRDWQWDLNRKVNCAISQEVDALAPQLRSSKFSDFLEHYQLRVGRSFIHTCTAPNQSAAIASRWARNTAAYPYFTQFIANHLFITWHRIFEIDKRRAIDLNDKQDLDILTHLIRADLVVSNEVGFLKAAFDQLWKPKRKVLMNSAQFVDLLTRLK